MSGMNKASVLAILAAESLGHYNWFEDRSPHAYEAGIQKVDSGWRVYGTDERAATRYDTVHADEEDALSKFLDLARHNHRRHWDESYKRYEQQLLRNFRDQQAGRGANQAP
jgi:hypothetical protein